MIEEVAASIFTNIVSSSLSKDSNLPDWIRQKFETNDPFSLEAKRYVKHILAEYNSMRIIGMTKPVVLTEIYINVNIRSQEPWFNENDGFYDDFPDESMDGYDSMLFDHADTEPPKNISAINLVKDNSKVQVLGRPGAGKTTFLKYIAISALKDNSPIKKIPVFISLKEWSQEKTVNLETVVVRQFEVCDLEHTKEFVKKLLKKGKLVLLLDGYDEMDSEFMNAAIQQIEGVTRKYPKNNYVISCRVAANSYVFENFIEAEVADFTENQVEVFIRKWFETAIADKFITELDSVDNKRIKDLSKNPLLLTLICIAYNESFSFPDSRVELYQTALGHLYKSGNRHLLLSGLEHQANNV